MNSSRRAFGAVVTTALIGSGLVLGVGSPAAADICLPPIPGLPPVCVPEVPGLPLPGLEPPVATTPTAITGTPKVGSVLSATAPTWSDATATTTYQWQQTGVAITDATEQTYTVRPADVGKQLTVVATGTNTLFLAGTSTSGAVTGVIGDAIVASTPPAITGTPTIGQTLTATPGTWPGTPIPTFTYQWLRDGVSVSSATGSTYAATAADAGHALSVIVTATRSGYKPGTATSATVPVKLGDAPTASTAPSISGNPVVGSVLTVLPGTWTGSPTPTFEYQWYADGALLSGATEATYIVQLADAGRSLIAVVTVKRTGYAPGTAGTSPITVAKVASTTRLGLPKKKIKQGTAGLLRITLGPSALRTSGQVQIFDGRKLLKTYTVRLADNGTRIVKLPKLKPGKHKLTARFAGTRATTASKSAPVVLTITRKR